MPHVKRKTITRYVAPDGKRCTSKDPGASKEVKHSKKFYGFYADEAGGKHCVPLHANRRRAERMLEDILEDASAPAHLRQRKRPLSEHLEEFLASVANARTGKRNLPPAPGRVGMLRARLARALAYLGWTRPGDLAGRAAEGYLCSLLEPPAPFAAPDGEWFALGDVLRSLGVGAAAVSRHVRRHSLAYSGGPGRGKLYPRATLLALAALRRDTRGMGPTAVAAHAATLRRFGAHVSRACGLPENPLGGLPVAVDPDGDGLHRRRALTPAEASRLLAAASASARTWAGLGGPARHALYVCVLSTGLRKGEAAALTAASFVLAGPTPHVYVPASVDKRGVACEQPLPPACLPVLRAHLGRVAPGGPVWPGPWASRAAWMLRADLAEAGVPYVVAGPGGPEYADFHALRHTFVASLDRAGLTLKTAMRLARHSTPALTSRVYGRAGREELGAAVASLAPLEAG